MSKIHVFPDENLGGVLREFVEVDYAAIPGDKVYIPGDDEYSTVTHIVNTSEYKLSNGFHVLINNTKTLKPTSIVHIDGVRYRMVGRNAKVGEKVIVVVANDALVYRNVGEIVEIIETNGDTFDGLLNPYDLGEKGAIYHFQYTTLEPIDDESPKTTEDLIANLARRVAELERKLGEYARKVDGMEVDIQNINVDLGAVEENVEMILDDIVTLDERTQPLVALVKAVKSGE